MNRIDTSVLLAAAINACCDHRGDDARNRAALLEECAAMPESMQSELIEHFEEQARWFGVATSALPPGSSFARTSP